MIDFISRFRDFKNKAIVHGENSLSYLELYSYIIESKYKKLEPYLFITKPTIENIQKLFAYLYNNKTVVLDNYNQFFVPNEVLDPIGKLILKTSGTTGKPKYVVHSIEHFLEKFNKIKESYRTLLFLNFDHIGGLDVLFSTLASGGTLVIEDSRNVSDVLKTLQDKCIEVFPTTPSFLNMLLISKEYENYMLDNLRVIAYGTEPMPKTLLDRLVYIFPAVKFKQTYGLTELGTLNSYSRYSDSLDIKLLEEYKIIDGILYIKKPTAMLGTIENGIFKEFDGWYCTGDLVEVNGDFIHILGRESNLINVGGNKVSPEHVEEVIKTYPRVLDVLVYSQKNPLLGNIVACDIVESLPIDLKELNSFLKDKLYKYEMPVVYNKRTEIDRTETGKKKRFK